MVDKNSFLNLPFGSCLATSCLKSYTHKIILDIDGKTVLFRGDENEVRAVIATEKLAGIITIDKGLLKSNY